jgi:hypothetical protein
VARPFGLLPRSRAHSLRFTFSNETDIYNHFLCYDYATFVSRESNTNITSEILPRFLLKKVTRAIDRWSAVETRILANQATRFGLRLRLRRTSSSCPYYAALGRLGRLGLIGTSSCPYYAALGRLGRLGRIGTSSCPYYAALGRLGQIGTSSCPSSSCPYDPATCARLSFHRDHFRSCCQGVLHLGEVSW